MSSEMPPSLRGTGRERQRACVRYQVSVFWHPVSKLGRVPIALIPVDRDGVIVASGLSSAEIGDLAADQELTVHELTPMRASLEDVFMELTSTSTEYRSHTADHAGAHVALPVP